MIGSERIIGGVDVPTTLLVTNDFPPRVGGIQRTLEALVRALPPDRVAVMAPSDREDARDDPHDRCRAYDRDAAFRVLRQPEAFVWPRSGISSRIQRCAEEVRADVVLFGATVPLALAGPGLASRGLPYLAAAHGLEYWTSIAPGTNTLMRYATSRASRVPVMCSEFVARRVRTAVSKSVPVSVLYPGADVDRFHPDVATEAVRAALRIEDRPSIVCVSRLVPRKGQDVLIRALPIVRRRVPGVALVIVGSGPHEAALRRLASEFAPDAVRFAGAVDEAELPSYYAAADVFAMPCRSRWGGMEVEGWGNVFIEAAACGRPVVAGDSGGARESLVDGETGLLVDGRSVGAVADALCTLLLDPGMAAKLGDAGRERVLRSHTWPRIARVLAGWLREAID
jgi:phosphatidyl-myo-inositol dimannoside synthase